MGGALLNDLSTFRGAEGRACSAFLRTGCALSIFALGTLLSERITGCCARGRAVSLLITGAVAAGDPLLFSLRSASCLFTGLLLFALFVLAAGRCGVTRSLLPVAGACRKFLEGLAVFGLLTVPLVRLSVARPDGFRGETAPWLLILLSEGRALLFAFRPALLSEGRALSNLLTGADCALLLYDTGLRLSLVTTSLRLL